MAVGFTGDDDFEHSCQDLCTEFLTLFKISSVNIKMFFWENIKNF